ncbi:AGC protein kinase [Saprolegnia parasitica CBS 223.65]|uniref:AGC protein kinase n=1 Tax=Saprolegnia parasitica (strain CBS 223.65) TaxID=695850 RepID=A0A067CQ67_SAPPC|nr:AGC protein kinase [Saprolegnia parasitica CBS 223.65]KDO28962.1 AGC protein kinase [Saprolegnia parasitica CBS 223.65]|eukprot:XP_012200174.1 AGC protein kinase [Saprolegnia parasitica CBS 223.65]
MVGDGSPDEILCAGYLTKRGHVVTNWKTRFFVLRPHAILCYYADESMAKKLGQVHLVKVAPWEYVSATTANSILKSTRGSDEMKFGFMFFTTKRVAYYVYANVNAERQKWLLALQDLYVVTSNATDCEGYLTKRTPGFSFLSSRPKYYVLTGTLLKCYHDEEGYRGHDVPSAKIHIKTVGKWEDGLMVQSETGSMLYLSTSHPDDQERWMRSVTTNVASAIKPISCAGYLTKQGHRRKSWKRRYFVLRGGTLAYYADYDSMNKQSLAEVGVEDVALWDGEQFGFQFITTEQVPYYVFAESDRERQKWMVALQTLVRTHSAPLHIPNVLAPPSSSNAKCCPKCRHMVTGSRFCGSCGHNVDLPYNKPPMVPRDGSEQSAYSSRSTSPAHRMSVQVPPRGPPPPHHHNNQQDHDDLLHDMEALSEGAQHLLIAVLEASPRASDLKRVTTALNDLSGASNSFVMLESVDVDVDNNGDDELDEALAKADLHSNDDDDAVRASIVHHDKVVVVPPTHEEEDYSESEDEAHPNQHEDPPPMRPSLLSASSIEEETKDDDNQKPSPVAASSSDDLANDDILPRQSSFGELDLKGIIGLEKEDEVAPRPMAATVVDTAKSLGHYLETKCNMESLYLPSKEAPLRCRIYASKHYTQMEKLLVFIGDSGSLGAWKHAESHAADDMDHPFSMRSYIERALHDGYGVLVCNPFLNAAIVYEDHGQSRAVPIPYSASPNEHVATVWTNLIYSAVSCPVDFVVAGAGGLTLLNLLVQNEETTAERIRRIALLQSTHTVDTHLSLVVLETLGRRAINWEGAVGLPLCGQVVGSQSRVGCVCLSTGFKDESNDDEAAPETPYALPLSSAHVKAMESAIFAFLLSNPPVPGMTAIVKDMRSTLRKGKGVFATKSARAALPKPSPEAATPMRATSSSSSVSTAPSSVTSFQPRGAGNPALAGIYVPGSKSNSSIFQVVQKRHMQAKESTRGAPISIKDFELLKVVGQGGFGKVFLGKKIAGENTGEIYAIKVLQKDQVLSSGLVHTTMAERHILIEVAHPFVVKLHYAFQSQSKLFLVMDYLSAGSLAVHLRRVRKFQESHARFYAAEIAAAIAHLHQINIIYRDVKLENVLMDHEGHVSIADFGLSKQGVSGLKGAKTFCGTAAYIAPELLKGQTYGKAADWWSFGILLYEMIGGKPPYYHRNRDIMFQTILKQQWVTFTAGFSDAAVDLIRGLLNRDPLHRLGSGPAGSDEVLMHPFFNEFDWAQLLQRKVTPPFDPRVSKTDTVFVPRNVNQNAVTARDRTGSILQNHDVGEFRGFSFISRPDDDLP